MTECRFPVLAPNVRAPTSWFTAVLESKRLHFTWNKALITVKTKYKKTNHHIFWGFLHETMPNILSNKVWCCVKLDQTEKERKGEENTDWKKIRGNKTKERHFNVKESSQVLSSCHHLPSSVGLENLLTLTSYLENCLVRSKASATQRMLKVWTFLLIKETRK